MVEAKAVDVIGKLQPLKLTLKESSNPVNIVQWGEGNNLPERQLLLSAQNHLKPQILTTTKDLLLGNGIGIYERKIVSGKESFVLIENEPLSDWLDEINAEELLAQLAHNLVTHANYFAQFVVEDIKGKTSIKKIICRDCNLVRSETQNEEERVEAYWLHPLWPKLKSAIEGEVVEPIRIAAHDYSEPKKFKEFIYHGKSSQPGQAIYDIPEWWGGENWTQVSNDIPRFHKAGLKNGYNVRYIVEVDASAFTPDDKMDAEAKQKEFQDKFEETLQGTDNAGTTILSVNQTNPLNNLTRPGIKVTPLANPIAGNDYNDLAKIADIASTSAHGLAAGLAGLDTGGKLGGSGSELRILYQLHIAMRTYRPRKVVLDVLNRVAKKILGVDIWPKNQVIKFKDINILTLAENPKGMTAPEVITSA